MEDTVHKLQRMGIIVDLDIIEKLKHMVFTIAHQSKGNHDYLAVRVRYPEERRYMALPRYVLGEIPRGMYVDHINRNSLDNRRVNLRLATPGQNSANIGPRKTAYRSSQYKGVHVTDVGTWTAKISYQGKIARLGTYAIEKDAAMAYDMAALEIYGEFAALTFPELLPIYQRRLGYDVSMQKVPQGEDLDSIDLTQ
jgi:hypothetical protein